MVDNKSLIILLISIIVVLTVSAAISVNSAFSEIKELTLEIKAKADSLNRISLKYIDLTNEYGKLTERLEGSQQNLEHLKQKVDSVLDLSNMSVNTLRSNIDSVLANQEHFEKMKKDENSFRFKPNAN